jgi:hypothetical protein
VCTAPPLRRSNALSGTLPASWGGFGELEELWLHDNRLEGTVPASWGGMGPRGRGVRRLSLFGNAGLSGCVPRGLEGMLLTAKISKKDEPVPPRSGTKITSEACP